MAFKIEQQKVARRITLVAALGYFVDVFDIVLFNIVKTDSLRDLRVLPEHMLVYEVGLLNWQLGGMLVGGLMWGIWGDKKGRLSVLFGSIITYSLANIFNAFITDVAWYAPLRFLAGVGLAGELGAGVTLVAETMEREKRGIGTMMITAVGVLGAVCAALVGKIMHWQTAYLIGGFMGLALLFLRAGTLESEMFERLLYNPDIKKGSLWLILRDKQRLLRYVWVVMIGLPVWFLGGIVVPQAHRFGEALGVTGPIFVNDAVIVFYLGIALGDLLSGGLSQWFKSRKKVLIGFHVVSFPLYTLLFATFGLSPTLFYMVLFLLGVTCGFWAVFISMAAEQFGTNIRSTVTNTVPNVVRGLTIPMTGVFLWVLPIVHGSMVLAAAWVGYGVLAIALVATLQVEETFSKDLNYVEK
ncbi:MAG: MFS transporter [Rhodothermia bacterium]|nr:MFS transporter [Rhodothermia bacterium]